MTEAQLSRFLAKVHKSQDGCWTWTAGHNAEGYGRFFIGGRDGKYWLAHRLAYEHWVGPIANGLQVDHLCRNPRCVNPQHLQPVSLAENVRRGVRGALYVPPSHCRHGHALDDDNAYQHPRSKGLQCRTCKREWMQRRRALMREVAA